MSDLEILKEIEEAGDCKLSEWKQAEKLEFENLTYEMDGPRVIGLNLEGVYFFEGVEGEEDAEEYSIMPDSFFKLQGLKRLYLNEVFCDKLPEFWNFKNLKILVLSNCSLTEVPKSLGDLTSLEELNLSENQLTSIPAELGNLKNLKKISLMQNHISHLPKELFDTSNITHANFSDNELESIPPEIEKWGNLKTLLVSNNNLKELPKEMANLKSLEHLDFKED